MVPIHGRRAARAALIGLLLTVAGSPLALAGGHMTNYHLSPEHDDIGRSSEPDGASTNVLGPLLATCNVDANLDGRCEPGAAAVNPATGSRVLAPGCTGDAGRSASGTCWLAVQTGGAAGERGMTGSGAPGAFTPLKSSQVRLFDLQQYIFPLRGFTNQNAKKNDLGLEGPLRAIDPNFGGDFVNPGPAGWHAWYGNWQDKNGNGVIDYMANAAGNDARNEWQWIGQCGNTPASECLPEPARTPPAVWFFPGNHHAFLVPDLPGMTAVCFATAAAQAGACTASIEDIDEYDNKFQGDPLLGPQNGINADSVLDDRTDDPTNARHYVMGNGFPLQHYDQSIVVGEVVVAAVDPPVGNIGGFDPGASRFRDVDLYRTWSPLLEEMLQGQVKPALRGPYVMARDAYVPLNKWVDGQANNRAFDTSDATGGADDAVTDPGFGREPNHAADSYPGATRGTCAGEATRTHWGFCNRYAGYQSGPHAYGDLQLTRSGYLVKPSVAGIGLPLVYGPQPIDGGSPAPPVRLAGDHGRHLAPGFYDALGNVGVWADNAHAMVEKVFDPLQGAAVTTNYVVSKDGWVGNVVNTTGTWRYRGYNPEACTLFGVAGIYEHGVCDPYNSGVTEDPHDYGTPDGEFAGSCVNGRVTVTVRPDTIWSAPTFVWRDLETFEVTSPQIEDFTGRSTPIALRVDCIAGIGATTGGFVGRDQLFLPLGNVATGVTSTLTASVTVGAGTETFVDVDYFRPS